MKGIVSFYEKPGCAGNEKQKQLLLNAGYKLQIVDMISKEWKSDDLSKFFKGVSIYDCINTRSPRVRKGGFNPQKLSENELLMEMIEDPLLIKRPLIFFRGEFAVGFDNNLITKLLGEKQKDNNCQKSNKDN